MYMHKSFLAVELTLGTLYGPGQLAVEQTVFQSYMLASADDNSFVDRLPCSLDFGHSHSTDYCVGGVLCESDLSRLRLLALFTIW